MLNDIEKNFLILLLEEELTKVKNNSSLIFTGESQAIKNNIVANINKIIQKLKKEVG